MKVLSNIMAATWAAATRPRSNSDDRIALCPKQTGQSTSSERFRGLINRSSAAIVSAARNVYYWGDKPPIVEICENCKKSHHLTSQKK